MVASSSIDIYVEVIISISFFFLSKKYGESANILSPYIYGEVPTN